MQGAVVVKSAHDNIRGLGHIGIQVEGQALFSYRSAKSAEPSYSKKR